MNNYNELPFYHFEDNVTGRIENPAELKLRDYTIEGNCGKNLIPYPYLNTTKTTNGITFKDNGDGTITVNGTTTASAYFRLATLTGIDRTKKYILSGSSTPVAVYVSLYQGNTWKKEIMSKNGDSIIVDFPSYTDIEYDRITIDAYIYHFNNGISANNITIKPQLEVHTCNNLWNLFSEYTFNGDGTSHKWNLSINDTFKSGYYTLSYICSEYTNVTLQEGQTTPVYFELTYSDGTKSYFGKTLEGEYSYNTEWGKKLSSITLIQHQKFISGTVTLKNIQFNERDISSEYEPYKKVGRKNLIPYPYLSTTTTINGITFRDNKDGTVTLNGTTTANAYFTFADLTNIIDKNKKYILSGSTENIPVYITLYQGKTWKKEIHSKGAPVIIDFPSYLKDFEYDRIIVSTCVYHNESGSTVNNITTKPQLTIGDNLTEVIPYNKVAIPIKISGKNLIPNTNVGYYTRNGLTLKKNTDGSIMVNGTATANETYTVNNKVLEYVDVTKKYILSGSISSKNSVFLAFYKDDTWQKEIHATNNSIFIDFKNIGVEYNRVSLCCTVRNGETCNNDVFKPQLELCETNNLWNILSEKEFVGNGDKYVWDIPISNLKKGRYRLSFNCTDYTDVVLEEGQSAPVYFECTYTDGTKSYYGVMDSLQYTYYTDKNKTLSDIMLIQHRKFKSGTVFLEDIQCYYFPTETKYESYIAPRTTNIILDKELGSNDIISMKNDNLPEIKLNKGTNFITIEADVQPKSVKYQYYTMNNSR